MGIFIIMPMPTHRLTRSCLEVVFAAQLTVNFEDHVEAFSNAG